MAIIPFDETGKLSTNLKNETHVLNTVNGVQHQYIVPKWAPFFKTGFTVYHREGNRFLEQDIDFIFSHHFQLADAKLADKVYGSITILDTTFTGTLDIQLQSLGGDFVDVTTQAINNGFDILTNLQSVLWESIVTPATFPPTSHEHVVTDIDGVNGVLEELRKIRVSIESQYNDLKMADINDLDSGFVQPMVSAANAIAAAVVQNGFNKSLTFYESALYETEVDLGAITPNTWLDTPLTFVVTEAGTYELLFSVNPDTGLDDVKIEYRWTLNNTEVPKSYLNGTSQAIPANTRLRLQTRVLGGSPTKFVISDATRGSTFKATRLGN